MDETDEVTDAARRLAKAIVERDGSALLAELAPDVRMRFLIPRGPFELHGADAAMAKFVEWFRDADPIRAKDLRVARLSDRISLRYRFELREGDGWYVVEQQLYLVLSAHGRIAGIDLICSGFRAIDDPDATQPTPRPAHRFDARGLGCGDGLAREFRRRMRAVPVGDVLLVEASDPAAKEDLPPLARMMGHTVHSVEPAGDGRLLITVERGR
jgi:TusA-related sulfurtransferase